MNPHENANKSILIPAQRRSLILDLIQQNSVISVQDLAQAIGVSLPTIRRDLARLADTGLVQRSYGGVSLKTSLGTTHEPDFQIAARTAKQEKVAIGRLAAERLSDHQSVIFDSSSTVYEAAYCALKRGLTLTAVTNDLRIAELLRQSTSIKLVVTGGTLRTGSCALLGEPGSSLLHRLHVDVALIGVHAITEAAFCDTSLEVASVKHLMVKAAKRVIVLADASKFETLAFCNAFESDSISEIITDQRVAPEVRARFEERGINVSLAEVDASGATNL